MVRPCSGRPRLLPPSGLRVSLSWRPCWAPGGSILGRARQAYPWPLLLAWGLRPSACCDTGDVTAHSGTLRAARHPELHEITWMREARGLS